MVYSISRFRFIGYLNGFVDDGTSKERFSVKRGELDSSVFR